jgi:hypothetical protein
MAYAFVKPHTRKTKTGRTKVKMHLRTLPIGNRRKVLLNIGDEVQHINSRKIGLIKEIRYGGQFGTHPYKVEWENGDESWYSRPELIMKKRMYNSDQSVVYR